MTSQVNQGLGLRDGAIATYNQSAAVSEVWANVKGVWADDRTSADGRYRILGTERSEFIVTDGAGVYRTGDQILVSKLSTEPGEAASRVTQTMTQNDEDLALRLQALLMQYPGARIYLSGSVEVDFPEDVGLVVSPRQMQTLEMAGSRVTLAYHPVELALSQLNDQWATGTLTVLVFE